jgi:hypothetical protein
MKCKDLLVSRFALKLNLCRYVLAKADPAATVRGRRTTMLSDSDINATRHARAAVGGTVACAVGGGRKRRRGGRVVCVHNSFDTICPFDRSTLSAPETFPSPGARVRACSLYRNDKSTHHSVCSRSLVI